MKMNMDLYDDWAGGVVDSLRADSLPVNTSPRGVNSALLSTGLGKAIVGSRRGSTPVLKVPNYEDGDLSEITSLYQQVSRPEPTNPEDISNAPKNYTYFTTQEENLYLVDLAGADHSSVGQLFSSSFRKPLWAQLNEVAYVANGKEQKKVRVASNSPVIENHGIVTPTKASSNAVSDGNFFAEAVAGGALTAATYRVAITQVNSATGHESNLSDYFTVTVSSSQQIQIKHKATDPQVNKTRIYVLKEGVMTDFRRMEAWEFDTSSVQTDLLGTSSDINTTLLLTFAPEPGSNGPPPSTVLGWVVHNNRLFGWDANNIYWSDISEIGPEPESFRAEAFLPVASGDGSPITVCHEANDNLLLILKGRSIYGLFGVDPNSWELRIIDPSLGCVSPYSIVTVEGITYFWSRLGPVAFQEGAPARQIGYELLGETTKPEAIYYPNARNICVGVDPPRRKVWWAFPSQEEVVYNNVMISYNYQLGVFESSKSDPYDVSCMLNMLDEFDRQFLYVGGYFGKIYKWWNADVDGVRLRNDQVLADSVTNTSPGVLEIDLDGVTSPYNVGQFIQIYGFDPIGMAVHPLEGVNLEVISVVSDIIEVAFSGSYSSYSGSNWAIMSFFDLSGSVDSATSTTLTVETGTNLDNEENLVGHYLYVYVPPMQTYQRRRITGVTGSTYTFDINSAWAIIPDSSYQWLLSAPVFEWDTHWQDNDSPFIYKRYMFAYMDAICDSGLTELTMDVFLNYTLGEPHKTFQLEIGGVGAVFDFSEFDLSFFGVESISRLRSRIAAVAPAYRYRIRHADPNRQIMILRIGTQAHSLTDKRS